jgi:hypothetical protein
MIYPPKLQTRALLGQTASCTKKATILFKADLSKAFDLLSWAFLLEILCHLGFSNAWVNWVAEILLTASMRVLLNRDPG